MYLEQVRWNIIGSKKELINPIWHKMVSVDLLTDLCNKVHSLLITAEFISLNAA